MSGLKIETKICENWSQQQLRDPLYITVPDFMKLVQPLLRYGNFSFFFNMAAAAILDFQKLEILTVRRMQGANMHHHTKFRQKQSNGCVDISI